MKIGVLKILYHIGRNKELKLPSPDLIDVIFNEPISSWEETLGLINTQDLSCLINAISNIAEVYSQLKPQTDSLTGFLYAALESR